MKASLGLRVMNVHPLIDQNGNRGVNVTFKVVAGKPLVARDKIASCFMSFDEFRALSEDGIVAISKIEDRT